MHRIALTGGIATGKSYCLQRVAALGAAVIDADVLARDAVAPGSAALQAIAARFGDAALLADGSLNRKAVAQIVFHDAKARATLESIVHPEVYRRIREWLANLPHGTRVAVADIPLVFETGQEHDFDHVIVAACDPEEQVRRVAARDGLSDADARARIRAQWPIDEKVKRAWRVIRTDHGFAETDRQVDAIYRELTSTR